MLFLRVPYVVGAVGLGQALLILALSTLVAVLTSISLAVVATNMRVGGGGEYYLGSRTLGIEFGGAINYATFFEMRAGSNSFRPSFRFGDPRVSLLGTLTCFGAILAINPFAGAVAALVLLSIYTYLRQRDVPDRWIDSGGSHHYTRSRHHLLALADQPLPTSDWRSCGLAFVPRDPDNREHLLTMASWLEGGSGFLTAVRLLEGTGPVHRRDAEAVQRDLQVEVSKIMPSGSARAVLVSDADVGVQTLMQAHGLGSVTTNLAVFGVRDLWASA